MHLKSLVVGHTLVIVYQYLEPNDAVIFLRSAISLESRSYGVTTYLLQDFFR